MIITFQEIVQRLNHFWKEKGCALHFGYDLEAGAGTFNPVTFFHCLGEAPYQAAFVEPSRRPTDGRYGRHPNRVQLFHQYQVILRPAPIDVQELYLKSLDALGLQIKEQDIQFVHDDWESPTLGAVGLGWEVRMNGMEISQFTYFQSMASIPVQPVVVELTYGLERLAMYLQKQPSIFKLHWNAEYTFEQTSRRLEQEWSQYNFNIASTDMWKKHFEDFEEEVKKLLAAQLPLPAYDFAIKASHAFNILDARGILSATERTHYIARIRNLNREIASLYIATLEEKDTCPQKNIDPPIPSVLPLPDVDFSKQCAKDLFVFEVGSEELPASDVEKGILSLKKRMEEICSSHAIEYGRLDVFGSPRRFTIIIHQLCEYVKISPKSPQKGPRVSQAFTADGTPTIAGKKFMQAMGAPLLDYESIKKQTPKDWDNVEGSVFINTLNDLEYLYGTMRTKYASIYQLFSEALPEAFAQITLPKKMVWDSSLFPYPRPIRWIFSMYGKKLFPCRIAHVSSGYYTRGHPQKSKGAIKLTSAQEYLAAFNLREDSIPNSNMTPGMDPTNSQIILDVNKRFSIIQKKMQEIIESQCLTVPSEQDPTTSKKTNNATALSPISNVLHNDTCKALMKYLAFSLENPELALVHIEKRFLELPHAVIQSVLYNHQQWFFLTPPPPSPPFCVVPSDNTLTAAILNDCKAVLSARLEDATFLLEQDKSLGLEKLNERLTSIILHERLGSLADKRARLCSIVESLHQWVPQHLSKQVQIVHLREAAYLCKADLASLLVSEFPELQGEIGSFYYEISHGKGPIPSGMKELYLSQHTTPETPLGVLLNLADKMDNINSYFWAELQPTSSTDPYALRRQAISVFHMLLKNKISGPLEQLIKITFPKTLPYAPLPEAHTTQQAIFDFMQKRLDQFISAHYPEGSDDLKGIVAAQQRISPYTEHNPFDLYDIYQRLQAWIHFKMENNHSFSQLCSTYKRVSGLLAENTQPYNPLLSTNDYERTLAEEINIWKAHWTQYIQSKYAKPNLGDKPTTPTLSAPQTNLVHVEGEGEGSYALFYMYMKNASFFLNSFLDNVKIEVEDEAVRANRISLLSTCFDLILSLIDLNKISLKKNHHS